MDIEATDFKAYIEEEGKVKISFFLGRKSKYKDKILNIHIPEKRAEKFIEEMMRVVWENKIK